MDVGVSYPLSIYTHCGLRDVWFDGSWWTFSVKTDANKPQGFAAIDVGSIRETSDTDAVYTSSQGVSVTLNRGGKNPGICN
jgi:hypothetical protein